MAAAPESVTAWQGRGGVHYYGRPGGSHVGSTGWRGGPGLGWRNGSWYRGVYGGSFGWWWISGGSWYRYPGPIYPYPDEVIAPTLIVPGPDQPMDANAPPQIWYWCGEPVGYYPYVDYCTIAWKTVAAPARVPTEGAALASAAPENSAPAEAAPWQPLPATDVAQ